MIKLYSHVWFFPYDLKVYVERGERIYFDRKEEGLVTEINSDGTYEVTKLHNSGSIGFTFLVTPDKVELYDNLH